MGVAKWGRRRSVALAVGLVSGALVVPIAQPTASAAPPTFSKAFAPSTIGPGGSSTLTFTISNPEVTAALDLAFTDELPAAITVAAPAKVSNTCQGTVSAAEGGGTISLVDGRVAALRSCTVSVDVTASTPGTHTNTSGDLTSSNGNAGTATADLTVATDRPGFSKAFAPSTVDLGERSTLTFTIDNTANPSNELNLDVADTFPTGMVIADPANASTDCGTATIPATLTATPGTATVTLDANGTAGFPAVAAGATCTVVVDVRATAAGSLGNTSGELLVDFSASSGFASAVLTSNVSALHITKEFTDDAVAPGGTATLEFSISNFARSDGAADVAFTDDLDAALSGLVAVGPLPTDPCGAGSTLTGTSTLTLADGVIAPGGSCTFSVSVSVPTAPGGGYVNTTSAVTATVAGSPVTGNAASDTLFVVAAPMLTKEFTDDPVAPGGSVTLHFEITDTTMSGGSTDIAFSDELTTFLPSTISVTLPADGFCGASSAIDLVTPTTDRRDLVMTGGSLASGATCAFDVVIDIPAGVAGNVYTNTTGPITATVDGASVTGQAATDDIVIIAAPVLVKEFIDDPVAPGDTTTLEFTITNGDAGDDVNDAASGDATDITFTDDLTTVAPGITAVGLPLTDVCGTGSALTGSAGDTLLTLTGGALAPLTSCTFAVTIQTAATTPQGVHTNTTSPLDATVLGSVVTSPAPSDDLLVADVAVTKSFTDDPVVPGGTVTLEFAIDNNSPTDDATGIQFNDDLDANLAGLAAAAGELPLSACGGTLSGGSGDTFLIFTGGSVPSGTSCSFSVVLDVPVADADTYTNVTSSIFASIGGNPVVLPPAVDDLVVAPAPELTLSKDFANSPVQIGATANLRFTISNPSVVDVDTIGFSDDLAAMGIPGLAASGLPLTDPCGTGSTLAGSAGNTLLTLTGGSLAAGGVCTFDVSVVVPVGASPGTYLNTTSTVAGDVGGVPVSGAAAQDLLVVDPPRDAQADLSITKTDSADPVLAGDQLTYTVTVTNAGPAPAAGVVVTDALPAGVTLVSTTGCAEDPNGVPTCSLGQIVAGGSASYTIIVDVGGSTAGTITNNASVSASTPDPDPSNNAVSEDTAVTPVADLSITKTDSADPVLAGDQLTYTVTVTNAGPSPAADVAVTDTLPAGVTFVSTAGCAEDPIGVPTCSLGSIAPGDSASYTVTVDVAADALGTITNTATVSSSTLDPDPTNDTATEDTDVVAEADLSIGKVDAQDPVFAGSGTSYTVTVTNAGPSDATGVVVTDTLPAGVTFVGTTGCAEDPNGVPTCTLGDIAAGGSASYTIEVAVDGDTAGTITNTASVASATPDPDPSNNTVSEDTAVIQGADLSIDKFDQHDPITWNKKLRWTITVFNAGPLDAVDVVVTDVLPAGVTFKKTNGCLEDNDGVPTCTLGDVAAGASASFVLTVDIDEGTLGTITNTASVASATPDPDPSNNTVSETTEVIPNGGGARSLAPAPAIGSAPPLAAAPPGSAPAQTPEPVVPAAGLPVTGSSGTSGILASAFGLLVLGLMLIVPTRRRRLTN